MKIKLINISLLITVLLAPTSFVNAQTIKDFDVVADGRNVLLEWTSNGENQVNEYRVQRSFDGRNFYTISDLEPVGSGHTYQYIDNDLYKNKLRTFYYRIEVCQNGGRSQFSWIEEITLSFSGILRTWGSIKAMFR
ncbi:MAG: hypothetical protein P9X24_10955 [Candidatus Hatepunaea meridiana]|nr:hypothetical protein [Candidatus Hatepunaea meridiana]